MIGRVFRAFLWLRWRILLNSFERHGARDRIERFSIAFEQLLPAIAVLLLVPSVLMLAGAGAYAGWQLARNEPGAVALELARMVLFGTTVFALAGPLMLPAGDRTNVVRLRLLPIPSALLYLTQTISAIADPWMLLAAALLVAIPPGLAAGGAAEAAVVAAAAGLALFATFVGLTVSAATLIQLATRDRRRGEVLTLIVIVVVPMLGILPGLLGHDGGRRDRDPARQEAPARTSGREPGMVALVPSEIYVSVTRGAVAGQPTGRRLLALVGAAVVVHAFAFAVFARVLASPGSSGSVRPGSRQWDVRLPGVSTVTAAVALAHFKLGLRTPRGRATMLSPILLFLVFAAVMLRRESSAEFGIIVLDSGIGLAAFTSVVALLSLVPFAMNQFAVDESGFTLAVLAPIHTESLLRGKAIGNALILAIPASVCIGGSLLLFPGGSTALWLSVPLGVAATYLLAAPAAAALSIVFPKAVDMDTIGRSNAHGAAGLLGTFGVLAAGVPCLALILLSIGGLGRPALAPVLLLLWIAVCAAASVFLFRAVARLFDLRRENLTLVVAG